MCGRIEKVMMKSKKYQPGNAVQTDHCLLADRFSCCQFYMQQKLPRRSLPGQNLSFSFLKNAGLFDTKGSG
jgi:hypothetical protein